VRIHRTLILHADAKEIQYFERDELLTNNPMSIIDMMNVYF